MTKTNIKSTRKPIGNKKIALMLMLHMLEFSGIDNMPLSQTLIANAISQVGEELNIDVDCDRKTVGRNLKLLSAVGYDIVNVKGRGYYIKSHMLTAEERYIMDKLITKSSLELEQKRTLLNKVCGVPNFLDAKTLKKYFNVE